jgi:hypothetical protein
MKYILFADYLNAASLSDSFMYDHEYWIGKDVQAVPAYLNYRPRHLSEGAGENRENSQDSLCRGQNSKWAPPEYKLDMPPLEPACSILYKNRNLY